VNIHTESQIQSKILKYLRKNYPKAVVWKLHEDPIFGVTGIPDICFIHAGFTYFFEVKKPGGVLSKIQEVTLKKLFHNGIIAEVVYGVEDVRRLLPPKGTTLWA